MSTVSKPTDFSIRAFGPALKARLDAHDDDIPFPNPEPEPAADDGPAWTWDASTDEDRWELGPDDVEPEDTRDNAVAFRPEPDAPGHPTLPMADWIECKAQELRLFNDSNCGHWLAAKLDEIAAECRQLRAETPDQFDGRSEAQADASAWNLTPTQWEARVRFDNAQEAQWLAQRADSDRRNAGVGCL